MTTIRCDRATFVAVLGTVLGAWAATGSASAAQTGGAQVPAPVAPVAPSNGQTGYGKHGTRAIVVAPTGLLGHTLFVRGTLPHAARRRVLLQRLDPKLGWRNERSGRVRSNTRLLIRWRADQPGRLRLRVVLAPRHGAIARAASAPVAQVNVYRPSRATFFGPGLYGNTTACGQILTPTLLGVAHKSLKCGTLVAILYKGRQIVVPVVDRGPYHAGYSWDLTQATADALAFTGADAIGYIRIAPAS